MKTFKELVISTNGCYVSISNEISYYLKYALGEMENQLHPRMVMDAAFEQADEAYTQGYGAAQKAKDYGLGYIAGKNATKGISYDSTLVSITGDEYNRLLKQDQKAKDAFSQGYEEGKKHFNEISIVELRRGNKAGRECAMTFCHNYKDAMDAVVKLRYRLDILCDDRFQE